jgi:ankyrin repeat protein
VFYRYLGDLSYTINLSDFPPEDVEYCYGQVRELKTMQELDTLDKYGVCKLELAVNHGDLLMILVLLENGCSHMKQGWKNLLEEYYVTIFDEGGETNVRHVWTPLITAVKDEELSGDSRLEIVNFLLTFDQNLNMGDEDYRTAAHWATFHGFPDILQALLVKGANVQETDIRVESLMGYAINKWTNTPAISMNLVYILLENDFDVDTTDADENTPLHLAVLALSREIVVILLRYHAKKWLTNEDGDTPIDIARTLGAQNMISLLKHQPMSGG